MDKWDQRCANLAKLVSLWSKDPGTKVGAAIVRPDKTVCSVGYNGFPRDVPDNPEWYADRDIKYKIIKHAESNAIHHANERLDGYTIYVYPLCPCASCAGDIIQRGIKRVVAVLTTEGAERYYANDPAFGFELSRMMFEHAGVEFEVVVDDCRIVEVCDGGTNSR